MSDAYNKMWDDYKENVAYQKKIAKAIGKRLEEDNKCSNIKSMMSAGHGEGDLDLPIIKDYLHDLQTFYGVDPRPTASEALNNGLKSLSQSITGFFSNDMIQSYKGPEEKVDLILMGHMMYYVLDNFQSVIDNAISWLNPGGWLVLSHANPNHFFRECDVILKGEGMQWTKFGLQRDKCKQHLKKNGFQVEDIPVPHGFDLGHSDDYLRKTIKLLNHIDITDDQLVKIKELMNDVPIFGSSVVEYEYQINIISKKE